MTFSPGAYWAARNRQTHHELGLVCARCCKPLISIPVKRWYVIPRIPIEQGGKKATNCVLVCEECYREIGQDGTKTIPLSELPCFTA